MSSRNPKLTVQESMQQKFMDEQAGTIAKQYYPGNSGGMKQEFANESLGIRSGRQSEINSGFDERKVKTEELYDSVSRPPVNNNNLKTDVPNNIQKSKAKIPSELGSGEAVQANVKQNLNDSWVNMAHKRKWNPESEEN